MKKGISYLLSAALVLGVLAPAAGAVKIGDIIGAAYNTDIVSYINHYAIPSYAANGTSVIVAEDLANFGFDVIWDQNSRALYIERNSYTQPNEMTFAKTAAAGTKFTDILATDIKVFADGIQIPSYAINGYTMIPLESLTMFGECNWVSEERALKLWVDGLHIRAEAQPVEQYIGNLTGIWQHTEYPGTIVEVTAQSGNIIDLYIECVNAKATRIATAEVYNVHLVNGTGTFDFTDSFGYSGTGVITFSGNSMTLTYSGVRGSGGWSITGTGGKFYR